MRLVSNKLRIENSEFRNWFIIIFLILNSQFLISCTDFSATRNQPDSLIPSPVAYVTAAPLPESTATPTLAPLATSTSPPSTAVPKKQPQDTTNAIGLWSERLIATQPFTGFLDVAFGLGAIELQKINPSLITLNARQFHVGFTDNYTSIRQSNPAWILTDARGRVAFSTRDGMPLVNIRDESVKDQIATNVVNWIAEQRYDGMILNDVGVDLIRATNSPTYTGNKPFTEQQRRDTVEGLIRAIRAKAPDKILIVGGYAWRDGTAYAARSSEAADLAAIGDGVHIDEFLHSPISDTTQFRDDAAWRRDIDYLSAISNDGRIVLVSTRLNPAETNIDLIRQWLRYTVTSYLLGKNGPRTYLQFDTGNLNYIGEPEFRAPLGAPEGDYVKLDNGVYQRKFARGIVLVNPTDRTIENIELDTDYTTLSNTPTRKIASMGAHTGIILLKA